MWTYLWLGIFVMSLVFEFLTTDLLSVWFAGGALVSMVLSICGVAWYIQVAVFFILSFVLLFCFRKIALKVFNKEESKTNARQSMNVKTFRTKSLPLVFILLYKIFLLK